MNDEDFARYRDERYAKALEYFDGRANDNQRGHRFFSLYVIVVAVLVTPILTFDPFGYGKIIAALLSPTVAIAAGVSAHFQFHENWLTYRRTWNSLQHELHWRDALIGDYKVAEDRNSLFVERIEEQISRVGEEWAKRQAAQERVSSKPNP